MTKIFADENFHRRKFLPTKFLPLRYQDHLTKFVQLKPVTSKRAPEIAYQLPDVLSISDAPNIIQSDNGGEFVNSIIDEHHSMWEGLKIVHGKPRHNQSQGSVERANRDIEDILTTWLHSNATTHWADGLRFVQVQVQVFFTLRGYVWTAKLV